MGYIYQNNNPKNKLVDDCVIRAIATATGKSWDDIYWDLSIEAFKAKDKLDANYVWGEYLEKNGFIRRKLPDTCPLCYTVRDFVRDHRHGIYVLADGQHAIAAIDGYYIDTMDTGDHAVLYFYVLERQ